MDKPVVVFNTIEFKRDVLDTIVSNASLAGEFLKRSARGHLYNVQEPEWGKNYRNKLVARLIDYEIERTPREVVLRIGVKRSSSGSHHGYYIELGSRTAPAHPFLRPAVFGNGKKIVGLLSGK
ncbi:MAG: hypothetical protein HUU38_28845 [Anaerolineales bacterium]|nr:hypothetical protein [Anaerolineales bacterium]